MVFLVEDGTGLPDATSLASVDWADAYLGATGYASDWEDLTQSRKEELLNSATAVVSNSFTFRGYLLNDLQSLPFPRRELIDRENRKISGVPSIVRNSVSELAYFLKNNNFLEDNELSSLESIKVGPIALEVSSANTSTKIVPDSVIRMLSEFGSYRYGRLRTRRLLAG